MRRGGSFKALLTCMLLGIGVAAVPSLVLESQYREISFFVRSPQMHPVLLKFLSLDLAGAVAGAKWLDLVSFYGERQLKKKVIPADFDWIRKSLQSQLYLDPLALDNYIFAAAVFPWRASRPEYSLQLLLFGALQRTNDWRMYLSLGYHLYSFFGDSEKAAEIWGIASDLDGRPDWLPSLTTMLLYEKRDLDGALEFLKALGNTDGDGSYPFREELQKMQQTISEVKKLQEVADAYKSRAGRSIQTLSDLVRARMLRFVPQDPMGGQYYWDSDTQKVETTTRLVPSRKDGQESQKLLPVWLEEDVARDLLSKHWTLS